MVFKGGKEGKMVVGVTLGGGGNQEGKNWGIWERKRGDKRGKQKSKMENLRGNQTKEGHIKGTNGGKIK